VLHTHEQVVKETSTPFVIVGMGWCNACLNISEDSKSKSRNVGNPKELRPSSGHDRCELDASEGEQCDGKDMCQPPTSPAICHIEQRVTSWSWLAMIPWSWHVRIKEELQQEP